MFCPLYGHKDFHNFQQANDLVSMSSSFVLDSTDNLYSGGLNMISKLAICLLHGIIFYLLSSNLCCPKLF